MDWELFEVSIVLKNARERIITSIFVVMTIQHLLWNLVKSPRGNSKVYNYWGVQY